ncbi:hypothetical protein DFH27DRAFT_523831 [Peziza echinospora]|nr:hypothetical protein DFH27DRAFT_523831 [Peziza echinospora]
MVTADESLHHSTITNMLEREGRVAQKDWSNFEICQAHPRLRHNLGPGPRCLQISEAEAQVLLVRVLDYQLHPALLGRSLPKHLQRCRFKDQSETKSVSSSSRNRRLQLEDDPEFEPGCGGGVGASLSASGSGGWDRRFPRAHMCSGCGGVSGPNRTLHGTGGPEVCPHNLPWWTTNSTSKHLVSVSGVLRVYDGQDILSPSRSCWTSTSHGTTSRNCWISPESKPAPQATPLLPPHQESSAADQRQADLSPTQWLCFLRRQQRQQRLRTTTTRTRTNLNQATEKKEEWKSFESDWMAELMGIRIVVPRFETFETYSTQKKEEEWKSFESDWMAEMMGVRINGPWESESKPNGDPSSPTGWLR